jgi:hypothetical protein
MVKGMVQSLSEIQQKECNTALSCYQISYHSCTYSLTIKCCSLLAYTALSCYQISYHSCTYSLTIKICCSLLAYTALSCYQISYHSYTYSLTIKICCSLLATLRYHVIKYHIIVTYSLTIKICCSLLAYTEVSCFQISYHSHLLTDHQNMLFTSRLH